MPRQACSIFAWGISVDERQYAIEIPFYKSFMAREAPDPPLQRKDHAFDVNMEGLITDCVPSVSAFGVKLDEQAASAESAEID